MDPTTLVKFYQILQQEYVMTSTSDNSIRQFLVKNTIRLTLTIRRHLLPICLTTAFLLGVWMIVSFPMIAVFIIDDEFKISDYAYLIFHFAGAGLAINALIMFPLALLAERLVALTKTLIVLIPACLFIISGVGLIRQFLLTRAFLDTVFSWAGVLVVFSLVFTVYWSSLWLGQAVVYGLQKLVKGISARAKRA
jgi:hypothetical protein